MLEPSPNRGSHDAPRYRGNLVRPVQCWVVGLLMNQTRKGSRHGRPLLPSLSHSLPYGYVSLDAFIVEFRRLPPGGVLSRHTAQRSLMAGCTMRSMRKPAVAVGMGLNEGSLHFDSGHGHRQIHAKNILTDWDGRLLSIPHHNRRHSFQKAFSRENISRKA